MSRHIPVNQYENEEAVSVRTGLSKKAAAAVLAVSVLAPVAAGFISAERAQQGYEQQIDRQYQEQQDLEWATMPQTEIAEAPTGQK